MLHGIDLAIAPGEFFVLLGPSGSGKTTILRILAGLESVSAGRVLMDGVDVTTREPGDARRRDGVPELCTLSAHDGRRRTSAFRSGWSAFRVARSARAVAAALAKVGIGHLLAAHARAALGRAAAARRAGARDRPQAAPVPARRAALEPRRQAAPRDPPRVEEAPALARCDDGLRHARPGRGDDARRPHRRLHGRPHRPGRHAAPRSSRGPRASPSPASSARRR